MVARLFSITAVGATNPSGNTESDRKELEVKNVPDGFQKYQLPVYLDEPSQLFVTFAQADAKVGRHSHNEGDGIRFVMGGSIVVDGQELTQGDWMFIPAGTEYDMQVGPNGSIMGYCYSCCCA